MYLTFVSIRQLIIELIICLYLRLIIVKSRFLVSLGSHLKWACKYVEFNFNTSAAIFSLIILGVSRLLGASFIGWAQKLIVLVIFLHRSIYSIITLYNSDRELEIAQLRIEQQYYTTDFFQLWYWPKS